MTRLNVLDYGKHALDLHRSRMDLAKTRGDLTAQEPGAYEAETGALKNFQEANQARKPRWKALLDGMAGGLAYSLKSAEGKKKREVYANMEKMLGGFEEAAQRLQEQNARNMRRQEDMDIKVVPSVVGYLTYLQHSPSYDDAFANLSARTAQLKTVMDFDGELVALNPRNYDVGIFKDRKTGQLKETPVSSLLPPELLKGRPDLNPYERAKDANQAALDRYNAASLRQRAQRNGQGNAQDAAKAAAEQEETHTYLKLYDLLQDPAIDPTSGMFTDLKNWAAQNIPVVGKFLGEGLAQQQAYRQETANLKGLAFRKNGYRNEAEFENIHTLPNNLSRDQALAFAADELRRRGIDVSQIRQRTGEGTAPPVAPQVKVQDPATGQIGLLSAEEAKTAVSRGGVIVP